MSSQYNIIIKVWKINGKSIVRFIDLLVEEGLKMKASARNSDDDFKEIEDIKKLAMDGNLSAIFIDSKYSEWPYISFDDNSEISFNFEGFVTRGTSLKQSREARENGDKLVKYAKKIFWVRGVKEGWIDSYNDKGGIKYVLGEVGFENYNNRMQIHGDRIRGDNRNEIFNMSVRCTKCDFKCDLKWKYYYNKAGTHEKKIKKSKMISKCKEAQMINFFGIRCPVCKKDSLEWLNKKDKKPRWTKGTKFIDRIREDEKK